MRKNIATIDYTIYLCLCMYLVVDAANGIAMNKYHLSISQPFKLFMLLLIIISILDRSERQRLIVSFYFFLLFLGMLFLYNTNRINLISTFINIIKSITIPICYSYFCIMAQNQQGDKNALVYSKVFNINCVVLLLNIGAGIAGIGDNVNTYGDFGVKGFFYAGNEVSILFCCFYYYLLRRIKKLKYIIIVYALSFACSLLIGTKTGVLASILLSIVDFYYRQTKKNKLVLRLLFPVIIIVLARVIYLVILETQFYQFIERRIIQRIGSDNLFNILLSGRLTFLENTYNYWKQNLSIPLFLFGIGIQEPIMKGIEIDFFDTFFNMGIIWLVIIFFFYVRLAYLSIIMKRINLFFFNVIILAISFTGGHVWTGVMAGVFYSYINASELYRAKREGR